jgi:hypothetical protein
MEFAMRKNTFEPIFFGTVFAAIALVGGRASAESKTSTSLIPVPVGLRAVSRK